jgi:UDP-N-acetylglucosamine 2-epimerase (non-hydrolysing)
MKVATILGTRPEIIRLSRVMAALDRYTDHVVIHTGQNYDYELNEVFFEDLDIRRPDIFLKAAGSSAAQTIGQVIAKSHEALERERPDAVLILGDTNSCLASISAKRLKIPIFHMEAGNRCFDDRVPEEINRRIVDHISDINLPYSSISREYLLREGLSPDRVIKTGSPMYEVLSHYQSKIERSGVLERLSLKAREFFVVSAHREENIDDPERFRNLVSILNHLATAFNLPVIVSLHPRTGNRIVAEGVSFADQVKLMKPLKFTDYVQLMKSARVALSDSGTITEESSILNMRALNLRDAHERPEGMEEGSVMMTGLDPACVLAAIKVLESQPIGTDRMLRIVSDYDVPNVSEKVARIILSYTEYVNRVVWKKK